MQHIDMEKCLTDSDILNLKSNCFNDRTTQAAPLFSRQEYKDRAMRLREKMFDSGIDLLHITAPDSMFYYHGYNARYYRGHGPTSEPPISGTFIHVDFEQILHFDYGMEADLLKETSIADEIRFLSEEKPLKELINAIITELGIMGWMNGCVGMEFSSHLPNPNVSMSFKKAFIECDCTVLDVTSLLRAQRRVKSEQELLYITEAARICDVGLNAAKATLRAGVNCRSVEGEIVNAMYNEGGEQAGIGNGVLCGSAAHLHAWTPNRTLEKNDIVVIDVKGVCNRYHATAVRTYYLGDPDKSLVKLHQLVSDSRRLFEQLVKTGVSIKDVCRTLRQFYVESGAWEFYEWVGGFDYGIAFPPDAVGEFYWSLDNPDQDSVLQNEIIAFYTLLHTKLADTYVVTKDGAKRLSVIAPEMFILDT